MLFDISEIDSAKKELIKYNSFHDGVVIKIEFVKNRILIEEGVIAKPLIKDKSGEFITDNDLSIVFIIYHNNYDCFNDEMRGIRIIHHDVLSFTFNQENGGDYSIIRKCTIDVIEGEYLIEYFDDNNSLFIKIWCHQIGFELINCPDIKNELP